MKTHRSTNFRTLRITINRLTLLSAWVVVGLLGGRPFVPLVQAQTGPAGDTCDWYVTINIHNVGRTTNDYLGYEITPWN